MYTEGLVYNVFDSRQEELTMLECIRHRAKSTGHRLFAVHGKPDEIHETENELNALLARQGKHQRNHQRRKRKNKVSKTVFHIVVDGVEDI